MLTTHLHELRNMNPSLIDQLLEKDKQLQEFHQKAKQNIEFGPRVVELYHEFKTLRQTLIQQLKQENIPIPWTLRIQVDELEKVNTTFTSSQDKNKKSRELMIICSLGILLIILGLSILY